jgi:hypothetical protein
MQGSAEGWRSTQWLVVERIDTPRGQWSKDQWIPIRFRVKRDIRILLSPRVGAIINGLLMCGST